MLCFGDISTAYSKLSNYKVHKHLLGGSLKCRFWSVGLGLPRACISKHPMGDAGWHCWAGQQWGFDRVGLFHRLTLPSALVFIHTCGWLHKSGGCVWLQPATGSLPPSLPPFLVSGGILGALLCLRVAEECTCFHRYCGDNEVLKKSAFSFYLLYS